MKAFIVKASSAVYRYLRPIIKTAILETIVEGVKVFLETVCKILCRLTAKWADEKADKPQKTISPYQSRSYGGSSYGGSPYGYCGDWE